MQKKHNVRKYRNVKAVVNGITFDSIVESNRYLFLLSLQNAGEIYDLKCQVPFAYSNELKTKVLFKYIADFTYKTKSCNEIVEDVKGVKTAIYNLKKKLIEDRFKIKIQEIFAADVAKKPVD